MGPKMLREPNTCSEDLAVDLRAEQQFRDPQQTLAQRALISSESHASPRGPGRCDKAETKALGGL